MTKRKRRGRLRKIEASQIILRDPEGKTRITLDAGGDNRYASIGLFASEGKNSLTIGTQPNGSVVMSFNDETFYGALTISAAGLALRSKDGRFAMTLGRIIDDTDSIIVFRDGKPVWRAAQKTKRKR